MILSINGLPKKGKTAYATYYAVKHYKKENHIINLTLRCIKSLIYYKEYKGIKEKIHIFKYELKQRCNNVFSNYPILLDKKRNIYSNIIDVNDMDMKYDFPYNSVIIIDEFQRYYDSREYVKFPKGIGVFMQHHRHGDIHSILLISQHPRRIDNKGRDLCEIFRKFKIFMSLPLFPFIVVYYTDYYEFEDYGKYNHVKNEIKTYDYKNKLMFVKKSNVFGRYDSKYFSSIFRKLPNVKMEQYTSLSLNDEQAEKVGII